MYVEQGAYKYLRDAGLGYMMDTDVLLNVTNGVEALVAAVQAWVTEPYELFRNYSTEYLHMQLTARGMQLYQDDPQVTKF